MNNYAISSCVYDGSAADLNPLCTIAGTVNGTDVFPQVFYRYLMAASAANQMQAALTAILFNWYAGVYGYQLTPWPAQISFPQFPASNASAAPSFGPYPVSPVSVPQALIGSWTV